MSTEADDFSNIIDLPEDILYIIIHYLPPRDFLAFCASTKIFQQNHDLRFSASYWSRLTRHTFRLPNQPVVAHDGKRWMSLYRRMRTQTKVYTWGNNDGGCLGGELQIEGPRVSRPRVGRVGGRFFGVRSQGMPPHLAWPGQMKKINWGIISDLQCGGWSTTVLNSQGSLYTLGNIDNEGSAYQSDSPVLKMLEYPRGFVAPSERYDPSTAVKQFSAGRKHILALSDSRRIWSWDNKNQPALHVKFLTIDLVEGRDNEFLNVEGRVTAVIAGWNKSSAYVVGKGIILWTPSNHAEIQGQSDQSSIDGMLVLESWIVPLSAYRNSPIRGTSSPSPDLDDDAARFTGEVTSWIVLSNFVVFVTTTGRLFVSRFSDYESTTPSTLCMNPDRDFSQPSDSGEFILDVQGAHQHFAIFKRDGSVLTSHEDRLHELWEANFHPERGINAPAAAFSKIPCLQNTGVISLAFGDHHYHALHSDGTITSYGRELQQCGALGLGDDDVAFTRGLAIEHGGVFLRDTSVLIPECCDTGRRVFFDEERREWLKWLAKDVSLEGNDRDLLALRSVKAEVSEWFERKLRNWESELPGIEHRIEEQGPIANATKGSRVLEFLKGNFTKSTVSAESAAQTPTSTSAGKEPESTPESKESDEEEDGLPAYFALSVAAAGWHSAALVLVNETKARRARDRCVYHGSSNSVLSSLNPTDQANRTPWIWEQQGQTFPRLALSTGEVIGPETGDDTPAERLERREWRAVEQVAL